LDDGVFVGKINNTVAEFLGIPFAESTTGKNRLQLPIPVEPYKGVIQATDFGPACPQQIAPAQSTPPGISTPSPSSGITQTSEDCLSVNVFKPLNAKEGDNFPVVAWIYGGGFEDGATVTYDGSIIVNRSIAVDQPIVFVSMNYRLAAWGFAGSKEVKEAGIGNLGLQDQRLAFKWIQKYVKNFGGDPKKVTIWGESAGAISVAMQMLTNDGNTGGLFRAGFMQSGAPTPIGDITEGQPFFDMLVANTGCNGSSDVLACLRSVSEERFQDAVNASPSISSFMSLNLAWQPRVDGRFLKDDPQRLVLSGSVADIPFINGNNDDEGTIFSLTQLNLTTDAEFLGYVQENYAPSATQADLNLIAQLYPSDPADGSPFGTGDANAITPQYKRLAAFQGDLVFHGPRRLFIGNRAARQPIWSFLNKRLKDTPIIGSFHGSDLEQTIFAHAELQDYLINFINNLDPNVDTEKGAERTENLVHWPQFDTESKQLLQILDGPVPLNLTVDDFREDAIQFLIDFSLAHPL